MCSADRKYNISSFYRLRNHSRVFIVPLDSDLYFAHFRKISPIFVVTNCFQSDLFIIANFLKLQNKVERVQLP